MTEQQITEETAKLACKKGFYIENDHSGYLIYPTQNLLQKWLRETHNIDCHVLPVRFIGDVEVGYYTYAVQSIQPVGKQKYRFDTWEEALEYALQEALGLIE